MCRLFLPEMGAVAVQNMICERMSNAPVRATDVVTFRATSSSAAAGRVKRAGMRKKALLTRRR